jgi:hypothetical protein
MRRFEWAKVGFACIVLSLFSVFSFSDQAENEYAYWSRFKPGTFVSFRCLTTSAGKTTEKIKTWKIDAVRPDAVIIDYFEAAATAAKLASAIVLPGRSRIEFRSADYPEGDLLGGLLGISLDKTLGDASGERVESAPEDLFVAGKTLHSMRTLIRFGRSDARTTVTLWICGEIPGRLIKFVREIKASGLSYREESQAIEYFSSKGGAGEMAKLKTERKPSAVEVSGLDLLIQESRFCKEFDQLMGDWPALEATLMMITPGNAPTAEASKKIYAFMEKIMAMKKHLEEDKGKIETLLVPSESNKINSFWPAASRFVEVFFDNHEFMAFMMNLESGEYKKLDFSALKEKTESLHRDLDAARSRLMSEMRALSGLRIKYIR